MQYIDGDTDRVAFGMGTNGSRSTVIGGTALWMAADKVIAKGKKIAGAHARGRRGRHRVRRRHFRVAGTDKAVALKEVAKAAFQPARCRRASKAGSTRPRTFAPKRDTYPNGCHVCEVEIDPETGDVTLPPTSSSTMSAR